MNKSILSKIFCLTMAMQSSYIFAQDFYKWVDKNGTTNYTKTPPPKGARNVGSVNTYVSKQDPVVPNHNYGYGRTNTYNQNYEQPSNSYRTQSKQPQRSAESEALRQKIIKEASTPLPGSRNGQLTASQRRTLAAMNGVNVSSGDSYSNSNSSYSAPMTQRQPSSITNCDSAGCWGSDGTRYNRGAGDTYFPSTGGVCQGVGGQMQCN